MIGETLNNRYRVIEQLGQGGMGSVYRALDIALNQKVAIKVLPYQFSVSPENEKRFEREFLALTNLSHPNIVKVFEYGKSGSIIFFVMEYLHGHDLRNIMKTKPKKPEDFIALLKVFMQACLALSYMHSQGIIHRDLKPQNIFIQKDGDLKVMDFGLAKLQGSSVNLTQDGAVLGTAIYMSPEQASGKPSDERSDIYSLGVILYNALCGIPPFSGNNPMEILKKHLFENPQIPTYHNPFIPQSLVTALAKAMEKDPEDRFQSAKEFSHDLQMIMRILIEKQKRNENYVSIVVNSLKKLLKRR
ncbi:serine/threonine protein kinase [candidate division CSSED10-310 bacterium]|uniref:non-specific serine/threonine protein kinase n=1 Tax=candidate division CSSED10-310 bacterium TaxID=2855610 RepID=A0ABV6Z0L2_UNCC1